MTDDYRDSSGRALADYPRPSVAVDTALLTVVDGTLSVLQCGARMCGAGRCRGRSCTRVSD